MSYSYFARFYDLLTDNAEYAEAAERYTTLAAQHGKGQGKALDLGCGTGSLSLELCRRCYEVIGCDISSDMLSYAYNKLLGNGYTVQFICQDMTELELGQQVDVIFSYLDCLNHLPSAEAVNQTFRQCAANLNEGGLLIFDVNTIYKHREVLADNAFVLDRDGVFCAWQNFYNEDDNSVEILLDFFEEEKVGRYERYAEELVEIAYELKDIEDWLAQAGFEVLGIYDGLSDSPVTENSERAVFCARKV